MGKAFLLWILCWLMLMIGVVTCWNSMIPFQGRHYLTSNCKFAKGCTSSMSSRSRSGVVCYGRAMYRQVGGSNNKTSLSPNEIEDLLKERSDARKVSNYDKADKILSQLKQKGVAVQDTFKIYRTDGLTNFDKETTFSRNNIDNDNSNNSPTNNQDSHNNNKKKKKSTMMKQKKGKSTTTTTATVVVYEYTKAVWSQPISTEEDVHIQKRLKVRSMAKMNRDFDVADDIRDELRYQNNVIIDDDSKSYRKVDFTTAAALSSSSSSSSSYTFGGKRLSNVSPEELQQIETLLSKRIQAKKKRDFVTADSILSQLEVQHAVRVYDKKKQWHFDKHRVLPTSTTNTSNNSNSNSNDYDGNGSFKGKTKQEKMTVQEAQSLSVKELRTLLRDNNLTIGGTKDKLIQRLLQKRIITKKKKTNQPFFVENTTSTTSTSTSQSGELDPNQSTGILTSDDDDDIYGDGMFFASSSIPDGISIIDNDMPDGISIIEPTTTSTTTDKITTEEEEEEKEEEDGSLNDLTVVELKEKLRAVGLPVSGNKMVLMERLQSMTTTMKEPKELSLLNHDTTASSSLLSRQELNEMTVVQLKEKLRDANLSVVGKKADLVDRLMKAT